MRLLEGGVSGSQDWRQFPRTLSHCPNELDPTRARSASQNVVVVITQHRPSMHEGTHDTPALCRGDATSDGVEIRGGKGCPLQQVVQRVLEAHHALLTLEVNERGGAVGGRR